VNPNQHPRPSDADFESLHAAHAGRIRAYFLRSGFPDSDADDLTQETFIRAFKSIRTFDPDRGSFRTWLAAIARNVARKRWGQRAAPDHFDPEIAEDVFAAPDNRTGSAEAREEIDALSECIDALPANLARVVHLRYVQAMTTRGVAAETGIPEATVRLRLSEALALLEGCLRAKGVLE